MRKSISIFIFFIGIFYTTAQTTDNRRFEYYFNGSYGIYLPKDASGALAKSGIVYTFQFQAYFKHNYFARLFFDQYNVNYKENKNFNGTTLNIDDNLVTNTYGLDLGYTFIESHKLSPYIYVGGGAATIKAPNLEFNESTNTLNSSSSSESFLTYRVGVGLEYEISKLFIISFESQYSSIPYETNLSDKQLNGVMTLIGFKTSLQ